MFIKKAINILLSILLLLIKLLIIDILNISLAILLLLIKLYIISVISSLLFI